MRIRTIDGALGVGLLLQFAVGIVTLGWVATYHDRHDTLRRELAHAQAALAGVSMLGVVPIESRDDPERLSRRMAQEIVAIATNIDRVEGAIGGAMAGEIRGRLAGVGEAVREAERLGWSEPSRAKVAVSLRELTGRVRELARRLGEEQIAVDAGSDRALGIGVLGLLLTFVGTAVLVLRRVHEPAAAITQALRRYTETRVLDIPPMEDKDLREIASALVAMDQRLRETTVSLERLQAEAAGRERAQRALRGLAERVPGVIYQYHRQADGTHSIPYASERLRDILGLDRDLVQRSVRPLMELVHPDDREALLRAIDGADPAVGSWRAEFRAIVPGRGLRYLQTEAIRDRREDGVDIWNGYLTDVTQTHLSAEQLRQAELRAAQAEKLSAIGTMVGGVSHEINNPLMAAMGFVAAAQQDLGEGEEKRLLGRAQQELERIARIVRSMLIFVRSGRASRHEVVDVAASVGRVEDILRLDPRSRDVRFRHEVAPDLPAVRCPEGTLDQVMLNLVRNAVDATAANDGPREVAVQARREEGFVVITVGDNGPGVAARDVARLFQPFFTTKAPGEGTGLGLSVTRHMLQVAGGDIAYVGSAAGAKFEIRLPVEQGTLQSRDAGYEGKSSGGRPGH